MKTIYSDGKTLEFERMLKCTVFLPQICHFCGEEIMKFGCEAKSLAFHSLDDNHDNWDPSNKVPAHFGCHSSFHTTKNNPMKDPETAKKTMKTRFKLYGPSGIKDPEVFSETMKKAAKQRWVTRREKYGPSGYKDIDAVWAARKEKYGSTGRKPKEAKAI